MTTTTQPVNGHQVTTVRVPETCNAGADSAPRGRMSWADRIATLQSAITDRNLTGKIKEWVVPPAILTDQPESIPDLARYAHAGAWTARRTGFTRGCGVWWWRLVALPYTAVSRTREWIIQRPGRAITVSVIVKITASTTWGTWTVTHLIVPAVHAAIWLFL